MNVIDIIENKLSVILLMLKLSLHYSYSLLFCLRYLPLRQALHIPILIHFSVRVEKLPKGAISFTEKLKHGMLVVGFDGNVGRSNSKSLISICRGGRLFVGNDIQLSKGVRIIIGKEGTMFIGNHFCCNCDCYFHCVSNITIGNHNMYGWNVNFSTTDGHHIIEDGIRKLREGNITIGNHVWIASYCDVSKNVYVADGCVVSQRSLLTKRYEQPNSLIGGIPAKVLKMGIEWEA